MSINNLRLLSYNIYGGVHNHEIIQGLKENDVNSDIICLQEFPADQELQKPFTKFIGNKYRHIKSLSWKLAERTIGLATFYDSTKFSLINTKIIHLPKINLRLHERLFCSSLTGRTPIFFDRTAIISVFSYKGVRFTIVNTHLAWEGGIGHQIAQVDFIIDELKKLKLLAGVVILCGDLNVIKDSRNGSLFIDTLKNYGFEEASYNIRYTCDFASPYSWPEDKVRPIRTFLKFIMQLASKFGVESRKKIDYVFGYNLGKNSSNLIKIGGSDHYPILTNFYLQN